MYYICALLCGIAAGIFIYRITHPGKERPFWCEYIPWGLLWIVCVIILNNR